MYSSFRFPTNSRYEGSWNKAIVTMDGFGCYTFPDGSVYQGYFSNGRFQGYGTLKMLFPQKFIIKGNFDHGKCIKMHELIFGDGLEFVGSFKSDGTLNSRKWNYCDQNDRLYFNEARMGLEPPGPNAFLTAQRKARTIPRGTYDTADGIFNPSTGFIALTENTGEKTKLRFVSCTADREYIKKNYRLSKGIEENPEPIEPCPEVSKQIMADNLKAMTHRYETASCMCKSKMDRDRYYKNLCTKHLRPDKKDGEQLSVSPRSDIDITPTSSTVESFGVSSKPSEEDIALQDQNKESSVESDEKPHISLYRQKEGIAKITRFSSPANIKHDEIFSD